MPRKIPISGHSDPLVLGKGSLERLLADRSLHLHRTRMPPLARAPNLMTEEPEPASRPKADPRSPDGGPPGELARVRQLAGTVAHDVNNMLLVILDCLEQTEREPLAPAIRDHLEQARFAARQASTQLHHLLRDAPPPARTSIDLNAVATATRPALQRLAGDRVEVQLELGSDLGFVRGDFAELGIAVFNLGHNAVEASPAGARIRVRTRNTTLTATCATATRALPAGDYVVLEVRDEGRGMAPDVQARMFDPFFTTKGGSGHGLGLATVARVVNECRGGIRVHSDPGNGTTIEVLLPRAGE